MATLTIATSRTVMKKAAPTMASVSQRRSAAGLIFLPWVAPGVVAVGERGSAAAYSCGGTAAGPPRKGNEGHAGPAKGPADSGRLVREDCAVASDVSAAADGM